MRKNKKLGNKFNFVFEKEQEAWKRASKKGDYSEWVNSFIIEHEEIFSSEVTKSDFCHYLKSRKKALLADNACNTTVLYPILLGFTMASLSFKYSEDIPLLLQNWAIMMGFLFLAIFSAIAIMTTIYAHHSRNEFIDDILSIFNEGSEET